METAFLASITGDRSVVSQEGIEQIIQALESIGFNLPEQERFHHVGNDSVKCHDNAYELLMNSDLVIAEISNESTGVGAEIADAYYLGKPLIALKHFNSSSNISKLVPQFFGNVYTLLHYHTIDEIPDLLRNVKPVSFEKPGRIKTHPAYIGDVSLPSLNEGAMISSFLNRGNSAIATCDDLSKVSKYLKGKAGSKYVPGELVFYECRNGSCDELYKILSPKDL